MAIIKFGTLVTGVRGTIGGATFSQNAATPYVKAWKKPINPATPAQLAASNKLASWPTAWRALAQSQRDAWDAWAALPAQQKINSLGIPYFATGFNWFVAINTWGTQIGFNQLPVPPATARPAPPTILTATVANTPLTANVTYNSGEFALNESIVVYVATWSSQAALSPPNSFRFIRGVVNPDPTTFEFQFQWTPVLGNPIIGQKAFIHVYKQSQQRYRSTPTLITADIVS